jgi:NAD(P)-dependent dehydrogenase (short-subunit alcohol dehydrogenase family)
VKDQVVVITGAGRGLGAGMARGLAARGARLALLDRDPSPLDEVVRDCGPQARAWTVDVTDAAGLAGVAEQVVARFGRVDVLVSNAGIGAGGSFLLDAPGAFEQVVEVNLLGSVRTTRAFLPALVDSRGHLLQVASLAAFTPAPFMSAYCTSKSGIEAFAHCLRGELAHHGVTVGVAYLAFTDTDMVRATDSDPALAQLRSSLPWPFGTTSPVEPAVARLVKGVERRSAHVYAQPWLRVLPLVRGALPSLTARAAGKQAEAAESAVRARSGR